jgi:hypothetical protein
MTSSGISASLNGLMVAAMTWLRAATASACAVRPAPPSSPGMRTASTVASATGKSIMSLIRQRTAFFSSPGSTPGASTWIIW